MGVVSQQMEMQVDLVNDDMAPSLENACIGLPLNTSTTFKYALPSNIKKQIHQIQSIYGT